MKELVTTIARTLVDYPDKINVTEIKGSQCQVLVLSADRQDLGKLIGKKGQTVQAMRTILAVISARNRRKVFLEIKE